MKPIRLPRQIATALQILRGVVDTDPQGEVCEASSDCTTEYSDRAPVEVRS